MAPTVSITSPATDTSLKGPANIIINAIAADADGSVTKVDFYNGSTLLGSDNTSPYSFTWKNIIRGNYIITAKATDNDGAVSTSASITLNVIKPNMAPTVSITSPVTNTSLNLLETETINIYATASDSDGFVTKVDFYKGATLIGSDSTSPYSFTWNNVAGGDYTITAKATDDSGAVTTSDAVLFSAITSNDAPAVNITSPKMDTSYTGPATIHIAATATDADGTIQKVEFYNGSTLLKTEYKIPYTCSWKNVPVGNYTITAVATDNRGNVTTSESVNVTVKVNIAPTVNITSPEIDQNFTGPAKIYMSAAASDTDGTIKKVEFYIDTTLLHTEYLIPYTYSWENVPGGSYTITAKATDNSGLSTTSSVSVTVTASTNTAPTLTVNAAPTVNITSPVSNSSYDSAQSITIEVAASDSDGTVAKVDFYNGDKLLGTDSTSPYNFTWNNVTPGNYSLTAKGYDDKGSATVSAVVPVVVSSPVAFAFKSFDGTANSKGNQLIWSTTNYKNTSYFKVLRGKRRMSLKQIGKVSYVSSNSTSPNYTFNDSAPYSGTSYYKIVQVDNLGKVVSSGIISVSDTTTVMGKVTATSINTLTEATDVQDKIIANNLKGITIKVGPNPTSDVVSVYTNGLILDKDLRISVLSINGVVLKTIQSKTSNQVVKINVSTFKNGMYIIEIASGDTKVYKQFIKD